jgi:hypothetical protein
MTIEHAIFSDSLLSGIRLDLQFSDFCNLELSVCRNDFTVTYKIALTLEAAYFKAGTTYNMAGFLSEINEDKIIP